MAEDIVADSDFLGKRGVGASAIYRDIRILSTSEIYALVESFMKVSGLRREQIAVNGWGFPLIPIPEPQIAYAHTRNAPKGISKAFFGHPIYWIDPEMTKRNEGEGEQEWCIRMFYLIDAFGYWTSEVEFIDFLRVNNFSFDKAQISAYNNIADDCVTDGYKLLDEDDLESSLESVSENYSAILRRCFAIQRQESIAMLQSQAREYAFAKKILGEHVLSWSASYDDQNGVWATRFQGGLQRIAEVYNERAVSGDPVFSDIRKEAVQRFQQLQEVVARYNEATSILELPVKASAGNGAGGASRIAYIATSMSLANRKDNLRKMVLNRVDEAISEAFDSGIKGENGFDDVINSMADIYASAWNRLRLAFVNFDNLRNEDEIYGSVVEMTSGLQASAVSGVTSLSSALAEDFRS